MILFDLPVYQFIMSVFVPSNVMTVIMKFITTLGSTLVIIAGIFSVALLVKDKKFFKIFLFGNLIGVIISSLIKLIVHRPRPTTTMMFTTESSYSFPSRSFYDVYDFLWFSYLLCSEICKEEVAS